MRVNPAARWRASPRARPCPRRAPRRLHARRPGKKSGVTTPASAAPARSIRNVTTSRREEGRYLAFWLGNTPTAGAFFFGRNGSPVLRNPHAPRVRCAARLRRGRADLQQRRRALGAVDRGGSEPPALPDGRERVLPQQEPVPPP